MAAPHRAGLTREVLQRARFVIFAKEAPTTLPEYDVDTDFCYYYFNDAMGQRSGMCPALLTTACRNAKADFPEDHLGYFQDDAAVMGSHPAPAVLDVIEPWQTPLTVTINHTRKTAIRVTSAGDGESDGVGELFVLGVFHPYDDMALGITRLRAGELPPPLPPLARVPERWCDAAVEQLPVSTIVYLNGDPAGTTPVASGAAPDGDGEGPPAVSAAPQALLINALARAAGDAFLHSAAEAFRLSWATTAEPGATVRPIESWESSSPALAAGADGQRAPRHRVFTWRPMGAEWTAVSLWPLPEQHPPAVLTALGLHRS